MFDASRFVWWIFDHSTLALLTMAAPMMAVNIFIIFGFCADAGLSALSANNTAKKIPHHFDMTSLNHKGESVDFAASTSDASKSYGKCCSFSR